MRKIKISAFEKIFEADLRSGVLELNLPNKNRRQVMVYVNKITKNAGKHGYAVDGVYQDIVSGIYHIHIKRKIQNA